jgi:DNA repair photolyase
MEKFNPLNVSSKFAICGIPIRVDTYKTCSYNCQYCFSNHRKIMEFEKSLQIGDVNSVKRTLNRIFDKNIIKSDNLLENLIAERITWHCGGMSDPFQPAEKQYKITEQLIDVTNNYNISILFSTKSDTYYNANLNPNLHTFQLSVTNLEDRKDIEPNIPNIKERIKFFNELKSKGFKVGIRVQPFIPNVTKVNIIDTFRDADYFTIEGLKLIPQNKDQKDYSTNLLSLQLNDFTQMGLLNLKPETRIELYKEFINKLNEYKIPFSIADNDLHHISSGKCCCGDVLIQKSTDFNNTAMINKYGLDYTISDVYDCLGCIGDCKANHLFTSNRQEGCKTVKEFYEKRFNRKSSPFSPKFLFEN